MKSIETFNELQNIQFLHEKAHKENKMMMDTDYSCLQCYKPSGWSSDRFEKFLTWCEEQFKVATFTMKTIESFQYLLGRENINSPLAQADIQMIVESFTYNEIPKGDLQAVKYLIHLVMILSEKFLLSLDETRERIKEYYATQIGTEYKTPSEHNTKNNSKENSPEKSPEVKPDEEIKFEVIEEQLGKYLKEIGAEYESEEEIIINTHEKPLTPPKINNSSESEFEESEESRANSPTPDNKTMTKIVKYTIFNGTEDEDPSEWISNFEKAAKANGLDDDERINAVPALLQGRAALWYDEEVKTVNGMKTYEGQGNFKTLFIKEFTSEAKKNKNTQELFSIKQGFNETIDQFTTRFLTLLRNSQQTLDDGMQVLLMLQGLNPQYSFLIRAHGPKNISEVINLAKQLEIGTQQTNIFSQNQPQINPVPFGSFGTLPPFNQQINPNQLTQVIQPQGFPNTNNTTTNNNLDKEIDEITEGLRKMRVEFNEVSKEFKKTKESTNKPQTQRYDNTRRNNYNDKREVRCYNCGKDGHIARECRAPRYNNRPNYRNEDRRNDYNNRSRDNERDDRSRTERRVNFNSSRNRSSSRHRDLNY